MIQAVFKFEWVAKKVTMRLFEIHSFEDFISSTRIFKFFQNYESDAKVQVCLQKALTNPLPLLIVRAYKDRALTAYFKGCYDETQILLVVAILPAGGPPDLLLVVLCLTSPNKAGATKQDKL